MEREPTANEPRERKVARRGLLAVVLGLGAAAFMKVAAPEKVQASDAQPLLISAINSGDPGSTSTRLISSPAPGRPSFFAVNGTSLLIAVSASDAIQGMTQSTGAGVRGVNAPGGVGAGAGLFGQSSPEGTAVYAAINPTGGDVPAAAAGHAIFASGASGLT